MSCSVLCDHIFPVMCHWWQLQRQISGESGLKIPAFISIFTFFTSNMPNQTNWAMSMSEKANKSSAAASNENQLSGHGGRLTLQTWSSPLFVTCGIVEAISRFGRSQIRRNYHFLCFCKTSICFHSLPLYWSFGSFIVVQAHQDIVTAESTHW